MPGIGARDRAERGRQVHDPGALGETRRQCLGQQERAFGIAREAVAQRIGLDRAEPLARIQDTGIVDQHADVQVEQADLADEFGDRARIGQGQRKNLQMSRVRTREPGQIERAPGLAAGRDDALAAREQLAHELESESAIGAGDESMGHRRTNSCGRPACPTGGG